VGVSDRDRPSIIEAAGMLPAITFSGHGSDSNRSLTNAELLEARSHELVHEPFGRWLVERREIGVDVSFGHDRESVTIGRGERLWTSPDELLDRFHLDTVPSSSGVTHLLFWRR